VLVPSAQPFGVRGQREQGLGSRLKEQVVQPTGMVQHQGVQGHRQGKHHMEVLYGQQTPLIPTFQTGLER
jgi:hypothetical protein